jgi:hypothetical protein
VFETTEASAMARDDDDELQGEELPGGFLRVAGGQDDDEENGNGVPAGGTPVRVAAAGDDSEVARLRAEVASLRGELRRATAASEIAALDADGDEPMSKHDAATLYRAFQSELDAREAQYAEQWRQGYDAVCDDVADRVEARRNDNDADVNGGEVNGGKAVSGRKKPTAGKAGGMRPGRKRNHLYVDQESGEVYVWTKPSEDDQVPADGVIVTPA